MQTPRYRVISRWSVRLSVLGAMLLFIVSFAVVFPQYTFGILEQDDFRLGLDLRGGTHLVYEADMSDIAEAERGSALSGVKDVVERRVNAFGVAEPIVQTTVTDGHHRIIIELAGVLDVTQAVQLIGETPILEFKEQNPNFDVEPNETQQSIIDSANTITQQKADEALQMALAGESLSVIASSYGVLTGEVTVKEGEGYDEAISAVRDGALAVGRVLPDVYDVADGWTILKFLEQTDAGYRFEEALFFETRFEHLDSYQSALWQNTELSGKDLKNAQVVFDPNTNEPYILLTFNENGAKLFEEITGRNVGFPVAIFLDGEVISAPTVNEKIVGGEAQIQGNFTLPEAKLLAQRLNAGALPVPLELISQQTVGPTLGKESLDLSLMAGLIGFLLVILFMIFYYRLPGVLSVLALILYVALNLFFWKLLDVTITLAGIAGFILSMGIAVDANVLIFARLKEELDSGRDLPTAVEEAMRRAWTSIRDGNMTTLIATAILFWFSTSFIKGFALTLAIGVLLSMFSAIVVTRALLRLVAGWRFVKLGWLFGVKK